MLEIRRGKRDNLGIIFHISPLKICCDSSLEPSCQDGSNEGSQHVFVEKQEKISLNHPQYPLLSGALINTGMSTHTLKVLTLLYSEWRKLHRL